MANLLIHVVASWLLIWSDFLLLFFPKALLVLDVHVLLAPHQVPLRRSRLVNPNSWVHELPGVEFSVCECTPGVFYMLCEMF